MSLSGSSASSRKNTGWCCSGSTSELGTQTEFFGVAIEVWKIDGSPPAPYFRVVAAPNEWRKRNVIRRPSRKSYREFREGLEKRLGLEDSDHNNPWLAISHVDGLNYSVDFPDRIFFSFQLDTRGNQSLEWCQWAFDRLERDKESIESALGRLEWKRPVAAKSGKHDCELLS